MLCGNAAKKPVDIAAAASIVSLFVSLLNFSFFSSYGIHVKIFKSFL